MLNLGSKDLIGEPFCYSVLNKVPNAELTINNGSEMKEWNLKPPNKNNVQSRPPLCHNGPSHSFRE